MVHLKSYKYQSVDKSFISNHILRHYVKLSLLEIKPMQHKLTSSQWNGAVKLLPMWLAPNMVTLLGFFCVLINVIFIQIYIPDLVGPGPTWVYYSFAAGLWM
jgi:ethanolaminephosphotransferase